MKPVVFIGIKRQQVEEKGWDSCEVSKRKIHEKYILVILGAIIVLLATAQWAEIPKLAEYMSFALTLASLILAIVAIGYAIYSNSSLEKNIYSIVRTTDQVRDMAGSLSTSSQSLAADVRILANLTGTIDTRIQSYHGRVEEMAAQIEKPPRSRAKRSNSASSKVVTQATPETNSEKPLDIAQLAYRSSIAGQLALYAGVASMLGNTDVSLSEMEKRGVGSASYMHGFLIGSEITGVFDGKLTQNAVLFTRAEGADQATLKAIEDIMLRDAESGTDSDFDLKTEVVKSLTILKGYLEEIGISVN